MVSFLLPNEQSERLSFLDLRDKEAEDDDDDDDDEDERVEVVEVVGLGGSSEQGDEGAEDAMLGQFSSDSSICMTAEMEDERRLMQASAGGGVDGGSFSGMAESL